MLDSFRGGSDALSPAGAEPARKRARTLPIRALEPRFVFDGAAAQTAADASHAADAQKAAEPAPKEAGAKEAGAAPHAEPQAADAPSGDHPAAARAAPAEERPRVEIVVIDRTVPDIATLLKGVPDTAEVLLIDSQRDGFDQLAEALRGRTGIDAIHILSHGREGELLLGASELTSATIQGRYADDLAAIGRALSADADLLIYGCDFAAGADGIEATRLLARATGADVAASDDATGHSDLGGDWDLEVHDGAIEAGAAIDAAAQGAWHHLLAPATIAISGAPLVKDGAGNTVGAPTTRNSVDYYDVNANLVGSTATYANAGTVGGVNVSLRATVLSIGSADDAVSFGTSSDDAAVLVRSTNAGTAPANNSGRVTLRWDLVRADNGQAIAADIDFQIGDIDGIGGAPNTRESVTAAQAGLTSYTVSSASDLVVDTSNNLVKAAGTADETASPPDSVSIIRFNWTNTSSWRMTYDLYANANTGQAAFIHDGNRGLTLSNGVTKSIPKVDLDTDDSSGATGNDYRAAYTEKGAGVAVTDIDPTVSNTAATVDSAKVTLTNAKPGDEVRVGTLPSGITASTDASVAGIITVTLSGAKSAAEYQTALRAVTFDSLSSDPDTADRIIDTHLISDGVQGTSSRATITVTAVNDAPVNAVPAAQSVAEDASLVFSTANGNALTISDPDARSGNLTTTLGVARGTLTLGSTTGVTVSGNGTGAVTLTGTAAQVNAALDGTAYRGAANYNGLESLSISTSDNGNTGTGGARTDADSVAITVTAVNDAPVNAVPAAQSVAEDANLVFSSANGNGNAITVSDLDAGSGNLTTTLSVAHGALTLGSTSGATVSGNGAGTVTVTGTAAQINAALNGAVYRAAADYNGADSLSVSTSDNGNTGSGGSLSDTDSVAITVTPIDDAPVSAAPATQATGEDATLVFSAANGNAVTVSDADGGAQTVRLAATNGLLSLGRTTGLTFADGDGDGAADAAMTFTGSIADINAALDGLAFAPTADYSGPAQITLRVTDPSKPATGFTNGGFEQPNFTGVDFHIVDDGSVPGWKTEAADHKIEIWDSGYNGVPAYEGDQFAEINANSVGALYQTFQSTAGSEINVQFAHRGRLGVDVMKVVATDLGADGTLGTADDVVLLDENVSDGNGAWRAYSRNLTQSASGDLIRFEFRSVSAAGGSPSVGNFVDGIAIGQSLVGQSRTDVTVTPVADAANDAITTPEDTRAGFNVLTGNGGASADSFEDPARAVTAATQGAHGAVTFTASGDVTYTPDRDFNGTDSFTYTVTSGGATETATVAITVTPIDDAPVSAAPATQATGEDATLVFSAANGNAVTVSDADGGAQTVRLAATNGLLTLGRTTGLTFADGDGDGDADAAMIFTGSIADINAALDGLAFAPTADYSGPAQITLRVTDPSKPATGFTNGGFEQPDFTGPGYYIVDDSGVPGWKSEAADHKIEIWDSGHEGVPAYEGGQFAEINANSVGALYQTFQSTAGSEINVQFAHRGRLGVDVMKVVATDLGADGTLGTADDVVLLDENVSDGNGAWRAYSRNLTQSASGDLIRFEFRSVASAGGSPSVGNFVDGIAIGQSLVGQSRIDVTVTPVADVADDAVSTQEDIARTFNALTGTGGGSADSFENPGRAVTAVTQGAHGTVAFTQAGDVTYTPDRDFNGTDGFTYTVTSGGVTETATVTMTVTPVNDAPVANADAVATREDTPVTFDPRANDTDVEGDALTISAIDGAAVGPGQTVAVANGGVTLGADGRLTFAPARDYSGPASFTYSVRDPSGATATATVSVTAIDPVNDAPVNRLPAGQSVAEDGGLVFSAATANAITVADVDAGSSSLTVTIGLGHGTLTLGSTAGVAATGDGTGALTLSGRLADINAALDGARYRPARDYNGPDSLAVTTSDNGNSGAGGALSDADALAITVTPVNDAPAMGALAPRSGRDGETVSLDLSGAATDPDGDRLTYSATGLPPGLAIDAATGMVAGRIDPSASLSGAYAVAITASDGRGGDATRTFSWAILNPAPDARDDALVARDEAAITGSVFADHGAGPDSDPDGDALAVVAVGGGASGVGRPVAGSRGGWFTIAADGAYGFEPGANFRDVPAGGSRDTSVAYAISDGQGGTSTATVTVTVLGANQAPTSDAIGDQVGADGQAVTLSLAAFFTDPDRDALTFSATGLPDGLAIDPATGAINGRIAPGASGPAGSTVYSATVTATDPSGAGAARSFGWRVTNPAPMAADDAATVAEDGMAAIDALANDRDPDGDALTIVAAGPFAPRAGHGSVTVAGGRLVYAPNADFNGADTIVYTVSDGDGGLASASVAVTVAPANDAPAARPIPDAGNRPGQPVSRDLAAFFRDPDTDPLVAQAPSGDALTFTATGLPPGLSIDPATGAISGIAAAGVSATTRYDAVITATDRGGLSASQGFAWTISNSAPIAAPDAAATAEDRAVTLVVTGNDSDPDGDAFALAAEPGSAAAGHGSVAVDAATGAITYAPDANFNGVDTITYTLRDSNGARAAGTLTVTVTPVNDRPAAAIVPDRSGADGEAASLALAPFFSDLDGDRLSFSADGLPPGLSIDPATGAISGIIDSGASGPSGLAAYRVTITARDRADPSDPQGLSASRAFTWAVTDPAPTALDDSAATLEDRAIDIDVVKAASADGAPGRDTDPDRDALAVIPDSLLAGNGTATLNPDGTVRYAPNPGFNGYDTILYRITDGNGGVSSASVTVRVDPVNDAPVAAEIPARDASDGDAVDLAAGAFFSDPDSGDGAPLSSPDRLSFSATGLPPGLSIDPATGRITGAIDRGASARAPGGAYSVTIAATDLAGATASTAFVWRIGNPAPIAEADSFGGDEDAIVTGSVLAGDSDPDGDALAVDTTPIRGPAHGALTLRADGSFTYAPDADFNGADSFTYALRDADGGAASATVTLTIAAVTDAPDANPDAAATTEDEPVTIAVLANDASRDGRPLSVVDAFVDPALGTVTIDADGSLVFTPAADFNGPVEIGYGLSDGQGATSRGVARVVVTPVNDAPVAGAEPVTTDEDTPVTGRITVVDPDGDAPSFTLVGPPANGAVTLGPDGSYTYAPSQDFNGEDSFTVEVSDGHGGVARLTIPVTVRPVNDAPVASAEPVAADEDTPVTGRITIVDPDGDAPSFALVDGPANGVVTLAPDGSYAYAPGHDFNGEDSFTIEVNDGHGGVARLTIPVAVAPVNDAPVANAEPVTTDEDTPVTGRITVVDPDGDAPSFALVDGPANGAVTLGPDGSYVYIPGKDVYGDDSFAVEVTDGMGGVARVAVNVAVTPVNDAPVASAEPVTTDEDTPVTGRIAVTDADGDAPSFALVDGPANGALTLAQDGSYTYAPSQDFNGEDSFTVEVSDGHGGVARLTIPIAVAAVNDAPMASSEPVTTDEDAPVTGQITVVDPDGGAPSFALVDGPANGALTLALDGSYAYTPGHDFNGEDSFTVEVSDGHGGVARLTIPVAVAAVNDAPVASAEPVTTDEDTPVTGRIAVVDPDGDAPSFALVDGPANGALTLALDGSYTYAPGQDFNGEDSFTVEVSDGHGGVARLTIPVAVAPVNDAPVASAEPVTADEDTPVTGRIAVTDADGDPPSFALVGPPANGAVALGPDGSYTYAPGKDVYGYDSFTVEVSDGHGGVARLTIPVTVRPVNDAPVASAEPVAADEDTPVTGRITVVDPDGDAPSFALVDGPANGVVTLAPDGSYVYTPGKDVYGEDSFTIEVNDGHGGVARLTIPVAVAPVNDAPVANAEPVTTDEDTPVTGRITVVDPDGDAPSFALVDGPANGAVTLGPDGSYVYIPGKDVYGDDSFAVEVTDGMGGVARVAVNVAVTPVNDAPVASAEPVTTDEDTPVTGRIAVTDADGDSPSFALVDGPANGAVTLAQDGSYTYAPGQDFNGEDSFTVEVSDGHGGVARLTIPIAVAAVNDAPMASSEPVTTDEDAPVTGQITVVDPDGGAPSFALVDEPANGALTLAQDGSYTYAPGHDFNGEDSFTVEVSDGHGGVARLTIPVAVAAVNDAPVASAEPVAAAAGADAAGRVVAADVDGDALDFTLRGGPADGAVTLGADGAFTYRAATGFSGRDAFQVAVADGKGGETVVTVSVSVAPANPIEVRQPALQPQLQPILAPPAAATAAERVGYEPSTTTGFVLAAVEQIQRLDNVGRVVLADGAVVRAVNGVTDLHGGADLSGARPVIQQAADQIERVSIARLEANQEIGKPWFDARPYLGRSLDFSLSGDVGGAALRGISMEAIRRSDSLVVNILDLAPSAASGIAEVRLRGIDGGPAPAWLEKSGRAMFWGRPPAGAETIAVEVEFTLRNGDVVKKPVSIDVQSGEIRALAKPRAGEGAAPPPTRRLAAGGPGSGAESSSVERAPIRP